MNFASNFRTMRRRIQFGVLCFLGVACLSITCAAAQEVNFIDLTKVGANPFQQKKFVPAEDCGLGSGGGAAFTVGDPPAAYPLKLLLLNLDASELRVGVDGSAVVLLRLQNTGHDPVSVPWTTDPGAVELPDDSGSFDYLQADLWATFSTGGAVNIPVRLYGSGKAPGSLQVLRPGEFAEMAVNLPLDCKSEEFHCKHIKAGPADLTFSWDESAVHQTYLKCGTQSASSRLRLLTSGPIAIVIVRSR